MLTKKQIEEIDEELIAAVERDNEARARQILMRDALEIAHERQILERAVAFVGRETTREEKLEHVIHVAATKLRMNDPQGALLTLEVGMRKDL